MTKEIEIEGEKVYLKKDFMGWRIVNPIKIDGKIVWKNLIAGGSWFKLILVFLFIVIFLLAINEYVNNLKVASACLRALPDYVNLNTYIQNPNLNVSMLIP